MSKKKTFPPGTLVWVHLRSYPWWPAEVVSETEEGLSEEVLEEKRPGTTLVRFFGESNYCWSPAKDMVRFRRAFDAHSKNNTRGLQRAIKEALEAEKERGQPPDSGSDAEEPTKKRKRTEEKESNGGTPKKRGRPKKSDSGEPKKSKEEKKEKKPKEKKEKKPKEEKKEKAPKEAKGKEDEDGGKERNKDKERKRKRLERHERREERRKKRKEKPDAPAAEDGAEKAQDPSAMLLNLNKQLRKSVIENNDGRVLHVLKKLKKASDVVTIKSLHESGLGKTVKRLTKHKDNDICAVSKELFAHYVKIMDAAIESGDIGKLNIHKDEPQQAEDAKPKAEAPPESPPKENGSAGSVAAAAPESEAKPEGGTPSVPSDTGREQEQPVGAMKVESKPEEKKTEEAPKVEEAPKEVPVAAEKEAEKQVEPEPEKMEVDEAPVPAAAKDERAEGEIAPAPPAGDAAGSTPQEQEAH